MKLVYQVHEKPPISKTLVYAFQQVLAIMAATILVPALINSNGTSNPTAVVVTVDGEYLVGDITNNLLWNIANYNGELTIYPNGSDSTWLYCIDDTTGVRVGTSTDNVFVIDNDYLMNVPTSDNPARYLGVYNLTAGAEPTWRCYTTIHNNIKDQTLAFYVLKTNCSHANTEDRAAIDATCTKTGHEAGTYCLDCDAYIVGGALIKANGHEFHLTSTKAASCTQNGKNTYHCEVCNKVKTETIKAKHSEDEGIVTAPTCTEKGYTTYTCTVCGDTYTGNEVEAKGHKYDAVVTAPTCTEKGYTTYTCACGDSYVADEVAAKGHTEGEAVTENEVAATCTTTGSYDSVVYYTACNAEISRETTTVEAKGHKHDAVVTAPTCTEKGYTTYTCACGDSYVADEVAAKGHTYDNDADATCNNCDHTREVEVTYVWQLVTNVGDLKVDDIIVIVAKGSNNALSTTQNNNNRGQTSVTKNSDNTVTINNNVQKLTLVNGTVSGTFAFSTGSGYLYAASSSNNYLRTEETLTSNSSWTISIAADGTATIKAQGSNTRNWLRYNSNNSLFACYSSGQQDVVIYKYTAVISSGLPCQHTNTSTTTENATCTAAGSETVTCKDCGETVSTETIPATGHKDNNSDNACDTCGTSMGSTIIEAKLDFSNACNRTSYSTDQQVWEQNGITLTNDKDKSTSNVGDYTNPARFYKNSKVTITVSSNITEIKFVCTSTGYASDLQESIGDKASVNGTTVTITLDGTSNTYSFTDSICIID